MRSSFPLRPSLVASSLLLRLRTVARRWGLTLPRAVALLLVGIVFVHRSLSFRASHRSWEHAAVTFIKRTCPRPVYVTQDESSTTATQASQICLVTLTDEASKSWQTRYFGWRNFDGLLALTWDNKHNYATKHGYRLFDESAVLDRSRPASWSKIRAVQRLLTEESCDWVFWLDADTVVMNSNKRVESFLPSAKDASSSDINLLLSADDGGGYNAGVWLIRNTPWSHRFLQEWWDMKQFVKPPGLAKSGDNDALKHKTAHMTENELKHFASPPRCTFNSFARFVPASSSTSDTRTTEALRSQQVEVKEQQQQQQSSESMPPYYLDEASYHKGDLIAHVAGVDNKVETIQLLLQEAV